MLMTVLGMKTRPTQLRINVHQSRLHQHPKKKEQAHQLKKISTGYMQTGCGMKLILLILKA